MVCVLCDLFGTQEDPFTERNWEQPGPRRRVPVRLQNSVPQRGTRPSILARIEGRLCEGAGGRPGRRVGPALAGHCWPDLLDHIRPSVDRVPPHSRPSRPAQLLSHSVRHRVEGQVSASCSCAQHTRRRPARSIALSRPVIGASQVSDEAAGREDLAMLMVAEGTPRAPAMSLPSIHLPRRCMSCAAPQEPRIRRSAQRTVCAEAADVRDDLSCSRERSSNLVPIAALQPVCPWTATAWLCGLWGS